VPLRVTIADPPAYTPPYDHALASALARAGAEVELLTSRFRFGETPAADGYRVQETLYPLSSRLHRRRARLAVKALEHPFALARLAAARPDVLHLQWLAAPEADTWLLHARSPLVFTAHDLLPRRTAARAKAWRRLFARFDAVVTHSESGRRALADLGVDPRTLHVIPHPVFRSDPVRVGDGRTVLVLGTLRPYKGVDDAVRATLRVPGARLLVAGDPRIPLGALREEAGERAEWRLGYLSAAEMERALGEATVALFPYRAELDQSGALLSALGAGLPAVVYDVGGLGEVVRAYGAGRVVPAGDVDALAAGLEELLHDPAALEAARAGARRAREELTWEAAAAAHLALYREVLR
jgi:glycosyltransferase involved in cell wall biosynthesis